MQKNNLEIKESTGSKNKRFQTLLSKENVIDAYKKTGSVRATARKFGVGATTIKRYMDKQSISF
jgi:DNA invertase Pin-like site-specific DNA recombinase